MAHDTDGFNSWDAGQQLSAKLIVDNVKKYQPGQPVEINQAYLEAFRHILTNDRLDPLLVSEMLILPAESYLLELMHEPDIGAIFNVRLAIRTQLAKTLRSDFLKHYRENETRVYSLDKEAMGKRRLKNLSLAYLMLLEEDDITTLAMKQFREANNLTDTMGVLNPLTQLDLPERQEALDEFYAKWQKEPLVLDKWLSLQAISSLENTFDIVKSLMDHPAFDLTNPNKVRALMGVFTYNYVRFHDKSGMPYTFLADQVLTIDAFNPQLAARLVEPLIRWRKYDKERQLLMKEQLQRIANVPKLSNDIYEIVTKSLV
jgi:aminopeptidase N